MIKKVLISAAGRGTRMLDLSKDKPKHLIEANGKPILYYLLSNLKEAGFDNIVTVRKNDFLKYKPESDKGILILNPPYGIRINSEEDVVPLYKEIGNKIKFDYTGFTAWVLSGNLPAMKFIGLKPQKKIILMNGAIECRYAKYEVFSGKLKENINLS